MHTDYMSPAIRQLRDQQVRFAPREKKTRAGRSAREAAGRARPERTYTYEYLCYRITDYRPEVVPRREADAARRPATICGCSSRTCPTRPTCRPRRSGEPVLTVEELSKQFNVSTKTISRWRRQGLVSRRFVFDGRKRVGFLRKLGRSLRRSATQERVRRGAQFSQLTDDERGEIIDRARRLARAGGCPAEVTRRLARQDGPQRRDDPLHAQAVRPASIPTWRFFPTITGPLREETKRKIYQQYRRGESVDALAKRFCRTQDQHLPHHQRDAGRADHGAAAGLHPQRRVSPGPVARSRSGSPRPAAAERRAAPKKPRLPSGLPPYLASLYEVPLLTREQEGAPVPQDELPEVQGGQAPRRARSGPAQERR